MWTIPLILYLAMVAIIGILAFIAHRPAMMDNPRGTADYGLFVIAVRLYVRLMHRARYLGTQHLPVGRDVGPLVVISNHTAGLDPTLIGARTDFDIRWMMAASYMSSELMWFWKYLRLIPVVRDGLDTGPAREAIRHVKAGNAVGIFPEGGLENPRCQIRPFIDGAALVVARTKAPVLLVWMSETPQSKKAYESLIKRSRSRIEFLGVFDFSGEKNVKKISQTLREKIADASGWPLNDEPLPTSRSGGMERDPFAL